MMSIATSTIDQATFESLIEAGAVRGTEVVGHAGGWSVVVKYGAVERALAQRRGAVRSFRKLETLIRYLKDAGVSQFNVNAANYDAAQLKATRARPDSAARMKAAFDAAAHTEWMQHKAARSLADPRPNVPHEQVVAKAKALIDVKRKQHAAKAKA